MNKFSLKSEHDDEQLNTRCIKIIGVLYFIILFWVLLFKCNVNEALNVDLNRSKTVWERFIQGITTDSIKKTIWAFKLRNYTEICAVFFNVIGLIPTGILFRCFYKRGKALVLSFLVIAFIEFFQLFTGYGGIETADFITNMIGSVIGVILFEKLVLKIKPKYLNNTIRFAIYPAFVLAVFGIVNTIIHFPG